MKSCLAFLGVFILVLVVIVIGVGILSLVFFDAVGPDGIFLFSILGGIGFLLFLVVVGHNYYTEYKYEKSLRLLEIARQQQNLDLIAHDQSGLLPVSVEFLRNPEFIFNQIEVQKLQQQSRALPGANAFNPTSINYSPRLTGKTMEVIPEIEESKTFSVPTFRELFNSRRLPNDKFLIGFNVKDNQPVYADWVQLYSALVGGQSGSGKSTLIRSLLFQSSLQGGNFLVIDPHYNAGTESLGYSLKGQKMLADVASNEKEIIDSLKLIDKIGGDRLHGKGDKNPTILVVDETTALLQRSNVADQLSKTLSKIAQETRKVGVYAFCIGQQFHSSIIDTTIRNSFVSMLGCRMRRDVARIMSGNTEFGKQAETLEIGQAIWLNPSGELLKLWVPNTVSSDSSLVVPSTDWKVVAEPTLEPRTEPRTELIKSLLKEGKGITEIVDQVWNLQGKKGRSYQNASKEFYEILGKLV